MFSLLLSELYYVSIPQRLQWFSVTGQCRYLNVFHYLSLGALSCSMANCQYGCDVLKGEVRCRCPSPGLQLGPDGRTCIGKWSVADLIFNIYFSLIEFSSLLWMHLKSSSGIFRMQCTCSSKRWLMRMEMYRSAVLKWSTSEMPSAFLQSCRFHWLST